MKRKVLQGLLMLGTVVGVCVGSSAIDASASTFKYEIDYNTQKLTVTECYYDSNNQQVSQDDLEVLFGVSTVKTKSGTTTLTTPAWEVYELKKVGGTDLATMNNKVATIDLSSLKNTADNYIQIKGNKTTEPVTIHIPSVIKKVKGTFDAIGGTVTLTDTAAKDEIKAPIEYRTQYGTWETYNPSSVKLDIYQQRGATLYFRTKAGTSGEIDEAKTSEIKDADGNPLKISEAGQFPGIEAKVAAAKLANAPKATANYIKQQVVIPAKAEYRYIPNDATALPDEWKSSTAKTTLDANLATPTLDISKDAIIEVRTAATTTKPASKIGILEYKAKKDITVKTGQTKDDTTYVMGAKVVTGSGEAEKTLVEVKEITTKSGKCTLNLESNDIVDAYEVIAVPAGTKPTFDAKVSGKVAAAKANADGTVKSVGKATIKNLEEGSDLYIRKVGNAKTAEWTTNYEKVGTVAEVPADATTPSDATTASE